jgi:hypothetical protein
MKGRRTLFDNFIPEGEKRVFKKGRSAHLLRKRDEMMMIRYFYYTEVKRYRFDDVLKVLSEEEFFIETQTILNRLTSLDLKIKEYFDNKPSLAKLKDICGNFLIEVTQKERERYEKNL